MYNMGRHTACAPVDLRPQLLSGSHFLFGHLLIVPHPRRTALAIGFLL